MTGFDSLEGFLDKWRERWPEWPMVERFLAPETQRRTLAWFALLQEFDDMLNVSGDPLPANAKLGWWSEELRGWDGQRSRHPLGRLLEPVRAPWQALAAALPDLVEARDTAADAGQARAALAGFAEAVAAIEAVLFESGADPRAGQAVVDQLLAQRALALGAAAVPSALGSEQAWLRVLLSQWPARVAGPRPRRLYAALARGRLQARLRGGTYQPSPAGLLWRGWWAARG
ncbi:squalene/phytoene synthase family protein [Stenotrophomonas mori]|uniref:Phytoene/squalene synthase family protein n=1 Tax=Stenotrophomonas mori TaxID=2871096 RepID=A0ABT0SEZ6_9GAMM|nr:squalene/phytoene synthase family protein [Stenotrophomonas mori]MCL7713889.1 phytoene/squalene synthase family protein [Stenotrophomonas mori]